MNINVTLKLYIAFQPFLFWKKSNIKLQFTRFFFSHGVVRDTWGDATSEDSFFVIERGILPEETTAWTMQFGELHRFLYHPDFHGHHETSNPPSVHRDSEYYKLWSLKPFHPVSKIYSLQGVCFWVITKFFPVIHCILFLLGIFIYEQKHLFRIPKKSRTTHWSNWITGHLTGNFRKFEIGLDNPQGMTHRVRLPMVKRSCMRRIRPEPMTDSHGTKKVYLPTHLPYIFCQM